MKKEIIIAQKNKDLTITNYSGDSMCGEGKYRVITKCQAGFMITSVKQAKSAIDVFRSYKIKHVHSIAFIKENDKLGGYDFMVYARAGKKVWIEEDLLRELEVGDIAIISTFLVHKSGDILDDSIRWSCHFRYTNMLDQDFIDRGFPNPYIYKPVIKDN